MNQDKEQLDRLENHFYKLNRAFLSIVKLWPYDPETIFAKVYRVFIFTMILSIVCVQFTTLYTGLSTELLIMVLSYALPILLAVIQYYLFYIKLDKVKQIWKFICDDINALKDQTERKIIKQSSDIATLTLIRLTALGMMGVIIFIFLLLSPIILDIVRPLKDPRQRTLMFSTEYFVDIQIYFYPILCHWAIGLFSMAITVIATTMFHIMCVYHICGLLKTGCYRIQHSLDKYATPNKQTDDSVIVQRISNAVQIHREAVKHIDICILEFMPNLTIAMIFVVASLSLALFRFFTAVIKFDIRDTQNMQEVGISTITAFLEFLIIFLGNNYLQKITDHHNEIFNTLCNVQWYKTPIKIQKLLLFIMAKTTKTYAINVSYMFTGSLENFTKVASIPISYFTTLYALTNS